MHIPFILFITGVSGAGKTTLLKKLCENISSTSVACFHFDSIGVPSLEVMIKEYGGPSQWQYAMTQKWVDKLLSEYPDKKLLILEGQINIQFIVDSCTQHNFTNYKVILIHADDKIRHERLRIDRNQPELVNAEMDNWAAFLKQQALKMNISIFDSGVMNLEQIILEIQKLINTK